MTVEQRWRRVQDLFDATVAWPPAEREVRLDGLESDPALKAEVLGLLDAADREQEANRSRARPATAAAIPASIGPNQVVRLAGSGGRGRVFEALRPAAGSMQRVAVKLMLEHLISPADLARFEREQRILVSLDHPSIARFVDAGWDESGRPFTVMEWVDGVAIDIHCRDAQLGRDQRIRLMIDVLDALQAAHRGLIAHLDLKPSNILVDRPGRVRVLDFGAARLLSEDATAPVTMQFTPRYASPEQLRGEPPSTACDLYSAGLLLHELLTGGMPFADSASLAALGERARADTVPQIATGSADLDAILHQALAFDPPARYASAAAFAGDLRAWLAHRPVAARRPTPGYHFTRWIRRNRAVTAISAAALLGLLGTGIYAARQQSERLREAERGRQTADFLRWLITSSAVPGSSRPALTVAEMVDRGSRRLDHPGLLPDDLAAGIQSDFAYLTQEHGREDLAEAMARKAVARANRSGQTTARLQSHRVLAAILMRRGTCTEAVSVLRASDRWAGEAGVSPEVSAIYLSTRASAAEQCEAALPQALTYISRALAIASTLPPLTRASLELQRALLLSRAGRSQDAIAATGRGIRYALADPDGRYSHIALLRIRSMAHTAARNPQAALADIRQAAAMAHGVVNPFEEMRLQTLLGGRLADTGQVAEAMDLARSTVGAARRRQSEIGPSFWMILADAAEVLARCQACPDALALYQEAAQLTPAGMPRTWRGNRLFFEAECASRSDPRRAASLAKAALETYGELLPAQSPRRLRLNQLSQSSQR